MARSKKEPLFATLTLAPTMAVVRADGWAAHAVDAELVTAMNDNPAVSGGDDLSWKPGAAAHLVVLRSEHALADLPAAHAAMHAAVLRASSVLAQRGLRLLPGGAHPVLAGSTSTQPRFPGADHAGWINNQSLIVRLPFTDDDFAKALAAVRVLLPILPALSAASPFSEGRTGASPDMRLVHQGQRFSAWPALAGPLMPEAVFTRDEYYPTVFTPIVRALADAGLHETVDVTAMDTRLATVSFDPDFIELSVLDGQESIGANIAIAELMAAVLRKLCNGRWISTYVQRAWDASDLADVLKSVLRDGPRAVIDNQQYLRTFGSDASTLSAAQLWEHIVAQVGKQLSARCRDHAALILREGDLAQRMVKSVGSSPTSATLATLCDGLHTSLLQDTVFRA